MDKWYFIKDLIARERAEAYNSGYAAGKDAEISNREFKEGKERYGREQYEKGEVVGHQKGFDLAERLIVKGRIDLELLDDLRTIYSLVCKVPHESGYLKIAKGKLNAIIQRMKYE